MITTWPRTCAGLSRLPRRIAASIPVYSAAWIPAVIRNVGPSRRPVMLKKGHEYFARPGSAANVKYPDFRSPDAAKGIGPRLLISLRHSRSAKASVLTYAAEDGP